MDNARDPFHIFLPNIKDVFLKNNEKIKNKIINLSLNHPTSFHVTTALYSMNVLINYKKLVSKFNSLEEKLLNYNGNI